MTTQKYALLSFSFQKEDDVWLGICNQTKTNVSADTLDSCRNKLREGVAKRSEETNAVITGKTPDFRKLMDKIDPNGEYETFRIDALSVEFREKAIYGVKEGFVGVTSIIHAL